MFMETVKLWLAEDGLDDVNYLLGQPESVVNCGLKIKSNLIFSGAPFVSYLLNEFGCFEAAKIISECEGKSFLKGDVILFSMPYNFLIMLERLILNILHRSCAITSTAFPMVQLAQNAHIKILDTRKTTPGLRFLEKYAASIAGVFNHRHNQTEQLMIKDNHKTYFGSLEAAYKVMCHKKPYYREVICEIHNLEELLVAQKIGIKYLMLDNLSSDDLKTAISLKKKEYFELSGGVNAENLASFLIPGIDAISLGMITFWPTKIDMSLKILK
jgi:nicotinate-nucleotide pyrophosphorylase (carboxylating)